MIHPPVGMNLFVIQAQAPEIKITDIYRGIIPFLVAPFVLIVILFMWPRPGAVAAQGPVQVTILSPAHQIPRRETPVLASRAAQAPSATAMRWRIDP